MLDHCLPLPDKVSEGGVDDAVENGIVSSVAVSGRTIHVVDAYTDPM